MIMAHMKERSRYIDEVSGLLILAMVSIHVTSRFEVDNTLLLKIFFYFMPWFYYKSGLFYKQKDLAGAIKQSVNKFLKPYIFYTLLGILLCLPWYSDGEIIIKSIKEIIKCGSCYFNIPLWFLMSLAFVHLLSQLLLKKIGKLLTAIISFLGSLFCFHFQINELSWIPYTFMGLFFYSIGASIANVNNKKTNRIIQITALLLVLAYCFSPSFVHMRSNRLESGLFEIWMLASGAACYLLIVIFRQHHKTSLMLCFIGENAMALLTTHWIVINLCLMLLPIQMSLYYKISITSIFILIAFISVYFLKKKLRTNYL